MDAREVAAMITAPLIALLAASAPLRVAVLVGNAAGAPDRPPLMHSTRDVLAMRDVLERLGGVSRSFVLLDRGPDALRSTWKELAAVIEPHAAEATIFFYYSGHASAEGLEMGAADYRYSELKSALAGTGAQLYVAVVDACQAGLLTRAKGGRPVQVVDLGRYGADQAQSGGVLITSGAPDELSQESDEIGGSFFTHYLLSGLRGAADDSGDRQVSLEEAYRFAYVHTVDRTGETLLGAQHPSWDVDVRGRGQLVLTWLSDGTSYAVLPEPAAGRFLVRDRATGRLAAELTKRPGKPLRIALDPGPYEIVHITGEAVSAAELRVEPGRDEAVDLARFTRRPRGYATAKGGASAQAWSVGGVVRSGYLAEASPSWGALARLRWPLGEWLAAGPVIGASAGSWRRADGLAVGVIEVAGGAFAEAGVALGARWRARAGVEARASWVHQTATDSAANDGLVIEPSVRAGALFTAATPVAVGLAGALGLAIFDRGGAALAVEPTVGLELSIEVSP